MARMSTAAAIAPTLSLTADQVAFFRREGYLRIERLTTDDEVGAHPRHAGEALRRARWTRAR